MLDGPNEHYHDAGCMRVIVFGVIIVVAYIAMVTSTLWATSRSDDTNILITESK